MAASPASCAAQVTVPRALIDAIGSAGAAAERSQVVHGAAVMDEGASLGFLVILRSAGGCVGEQPVFADVAGAAVDSLEPIQIDQAVARCRQPASGGQGERQGDAPAGKCRRDERLKLLA
ncbi:hypothetical protein [Eleftheria terrae]|uniref:hypothetical protein n=1 Tax=Eleftheria terrae TaxID=1597781 RepID=UPI00263BC4BA|nr:hypothetical protein [Eleftheria terrae]WKB53727.1 hypothetical protein N7L95_04870 [Eleftheria terrae]